MNKKSLNKDSLYFQRNSHRDDNVDLVCNKLLVNKKTSFKYQIRDTTYIFCSKKCRDEFSYTPKKYV
jgi:YHS domain-containing protein